MQSFFELLQQTHLFFFLETKKENIEFFQNFKNLKKNKIF